MRSRRAPVRHSDPKVSVHASNGRLLVFKTAPRSQIAPFTIAPARRRVFETNSKHRKKSTAPCLLWAEAKDGGHLAQAADAPMGRKSPKSRCKRRTKKPSLWPSRTLLPLDDVLGCLRDTMPNLSRSALHRRLQYHDEVGLRRAFPRGSTTKSDHCRCGSCTGQCVWFGSSL